MFTNKSFFYKSHGESLNTNTKGLLIGVFRDLHFIPFFNERTKEKYTAEELSTPLAHLFNSSLISGVMPTLWKSANITPQHKGDKIKCVENHRSISLTEWQHCFIKSRSCVTHLILTHHYWAKSFDNGCQGDVAFLDFSKDFDGVCHSVLLRTLCGFGVSGSLPSWYNS